MKFSYLILAFAGAGVAYVANKKSSFIRKLTRTPEQETVEQSPYSSDTLAQRYEQNSFNTPSVLQPLIPESDSSLNRLATIFNVGGNEVNTPIITLSPHNTLNNNALLDASGADYYVTMSETDYSSAGFTNFLSARPRPTQLEPQPFIAPLPVIKPKKPKYQVFG